MGHFARLAAFVFAATFSLHAAGCGSSAVSKPPVPAAAVQASAPVAQQLIVKFKPKSVACTEQAIARFSKTADLMLEWLRPMSGDACVVTHIAASPAELARAQARMKQHPDIEWIEIDAPMQHHSGR